MFIDEDYIYILMNYDEIAGVIDYNFLCFRKAIQQVFELRNKALAATSVNDHSASPVSINESSNLAVVSQSGMIGQNGAVTLTQS